MSSILKMKLMVLILILINTAYAQQKLEVLLLSSLDSLPIDGVTLKFNKQRIVSSDTKGSIVLPSTDKGTTVLISHMSFQSMTYVLSSSWLQKVYLIPKEGVIEQVDVINTGYFQAPKERLSGSYTHIDNKLLNRSPSPNLLDRLEGITNGLQFDRGSLSEEHTDGAPLLRVRGASTLISDARPLIIVDDFPFDGDLRSINPNDVESVTILKDASAASIWGARAGNGVIVINMKKGGFGQKPSISFQSNLSISPRPDLFFNKNVVRPETVMELQKKLFEAKGYVETNNHALLPLYVELLIKKRDGLVDDASFAQQEALFQKSDIRRDALDYLYRPAVLQQYNLQVQGGERIYRYAISGNMERNKQNIHGQFQDKFNLSFQNGLKIRDYLNFELFGRYNATNGQTNGMSNSMLGNTNLYVPLVDEQGASQPVLYPTSIARFAYQERAESLGLLDWLYRPVDELDYSRIKTKQQQSTIGANLDWTLPFRLKLKASYYYSRDNRNASSLYLPESYYARNLVNRFTQSNGTRIIPIGGIREDKADQTSNSHFFRLLADFNADWKAWKIFTLAGAEASASRSETGYPFTFFGYDPETEMGSPQTLFSRDNYPTLPRGLPGLIPIVVTNPASTLDRNLSGFANVGTVWKERYVLNGSIRWDGSNLIGVKSNARGVALWSVGGAWNIHQEPFFKSDMLSVLKLRTTVGAAGNINKSQGHLPVISRHNDAESARAYARLLSSGNPSLRWEQVNTWNVGLDWALKSMQLNGSVEYYNKHAVDLMSGNIVDPTLGVPDGFMQNYSNLRTRGMDITLQHMLPFGQVKLRSNLLFNYSDNVVTKVNMPVQRDAINYLVKPYYQINESTDLLYAFPFHGLSPTDGSIIIKDKDGNIVDDVSAYSNNLKLDEFIVAGKTVAPYYASYRLGLDWKGVQVSALFIGKFGHVARRNSTMQGMENGASTLPNLHMDYYQRWQKPGDELHTTVPATLPKVDYAYVNFYKYNEVLVTPLDYIGCKDINLAYQIPESYLKRLFIDRLQVYASLDRVGVLWKKNDKGVHPEYPNTIYPAARTYYVGLRANF